MIYNISASIQFHFKQSINNDDDDDDDDDFFIYLYLINRL